MYYVYRFINDEGKIIYVGKSKHLKTRVSNHIRKRKWKDEIYQIEVAKCITESDMNVYELYYISKHSPKYNKDCKTNDELTFELEDLQFNKYEDIEIKNSTSSGALLCIKYTKLRDLFKDCNIFTIGLFYSLIHYLLIDGSNKLGYYYAKIEWYDELNISKNTFNKHFEILEELNLVSFIRSRGIYINPKYVYFNEYTIKEETINIFNKEECN